MFCRIFCDTASFHILCAVDNSTIITPNFCAICVNLTELKPFGVCLGQLTVVTIINSCNLKFISQRWIHWIFSESTTSCSWRILVTDISRKPYRPPWQCCAMIIVTRLNKRHLWRMTLINDFGHRVTTEKRTLADLASLWTASIHQITFKSSCTIDWLQHIPLCFKRHLYSDKNHSIKGQVPTKRKGHRSVYGRN